MPSNQDYFKFVQMEIKPHMREIVVDWMFEVCYSAVPNEPEVFTLAVNFLDRLISMLSIDGQAACLRSGIDKSEYPFRDLSIVRPFNKCCYTSRGFKQPSSDQAEEAGH